MESGRRDAEQLKQVRRDVHRVRTVWERWGEVDADYFHAVGVEDGDEVLWEGIRAFEW